MSDPQTQPSTPLPTGWLVEGYRIRQMIARGGFSFVYQVVNASGETFALKEYFPHGMVWREDREIEPTVIPEKEKAFLFGLKCFFEEGRTLAQINHPHVIRVYNLLRAHETVYLVMAYEEGKSLHDYIRTKRGHLRESFIRALALRLLSALRDVHARQLLHLDLKPANIFLRKGGNPVILDFGSARQGIAHEMQWVRTMFTPGYAPPEQLAADRHAIGPWTDLYAVGGILYACMTGVAPPKAEERQKHDKVPERLHALADTYSKELLELTKQLLSLDPLKRPQSAYSIFKRLMESGFLNTPTLMSRSLDSVLSPETRMITGGQGDPR